LKPCFVEKRTAHPREQPGHLAVGVGVDEVRVEEVGPVPREVAGQLQERDRVDVTAQGDRVQRHAAGLELAGEVPRAGLVLVQHQHPHVPAALAEQRQ